MKLRRYFRDHALETLRERKMMVSSASVFNDPSDCLPIINPPDIEDVRKIVERSPEKFAERYTDGNIGKVADIETLQQIREVLMKEEGLKDLRSCFDPIFRICCFERAGLADYESERMLWQRYTHHKGIRITFDIEPENRIIYWTHPIEYVEELPRYSLSEFLDTDPEKRRKLFQRITTIKTKKWQYEHEWRFFTIQDYSEPLHDKKDSTRHLFPFRDVFQEVIAVDFGLCCPTRDMIRMFRFLKKKIKNIRISRLEKLLLMLIIG